MAADGRYFSSDQYGYPVNLYGGVWPAEDDQQVCLTLLPLLSLLSGSVWVMATSGRAVFGLAAVGVLACRA